MDDKKIKKLVLSALFAAITCVVTMMIRVPSLGPDGYANIGDTIVLLSAWLIGGVWGGLAAGIGSGLADFFAGYGHFVPGTTVIKGLMAVAAYLVFTGVIKVSGVKNSESKETKKGVLDTKKAVAYVVSAIVAELVMIAGYFVFEIVFLSYGVGAFGAAVSNSFQALTNVVLSVVVINALEKARAVSFIKRIVGKTA